MLENVYFISMEGRSDFRVGDFLVRDDIPLPVYVEEGEQFTVEQISPKNVIAGMIKVLKDDPENENLEYYRDFIFTVQPDIEADLSAAAYEAERNLDFSDAIDIFRTMVALKPSLENSLNIAICYDEYSHHLYSIGREKDADQMEEMAYRFFMAVDEFEDKSDSAYFYLGRFYISRENYERALDYLKEFIVMTKDSERKSEVLKIINEIKEQGINDEDYRRACELVEADKDEDSLGYIDSYLKKYPESWGGHFTKGVALRKCERYEEAISSLMTALKYNEHSRDIYNELGLCYLNLDKFLQAEKYFFHSLRESGEDMAVYHNLALLEYKRGKRSEAIKYCKIILEFNPDDIHAKDMLKFFEEES